MAHDLVLEEIDENGLLEQAHSLMKREMWHDAVALLSQHQHIIDKSVECLGALAYCYSRNKDYSKASQIYEELCIDNPKGLSGYIALPISIVQRGISRLRLKHMKNAWNFRRSG